MLEQAFRMHGVADAVMSFLALPHWHAKSVALHPALLMAVLRQVREQEGSWAWREEIDCADARERERVRVRRVVRVEGNIIGDGDLLLRWSDDVVDLTV